MQLLSAIQAPSAIKACSAIQACSGITAIPAVEEEVVALTNTYAVDFDGVDDHMDLGSISDLSSATNFSIGGWFKCNSASQNSLGQIFGAWGAVANNNIGIAPNYNLDNFYFVVRSGSGTASLFVSNMSLHAPEDHWNHFVVTYDNGDRKIYLNGVERASDTGVAPTTTSATAGDTVHWGNREGDYLTGLLDETFISANTLTAAQVTAIYNDGVPTNIASYSPIGWWRMGDNDDGTGTTITDQGSGANNGTLTNGPTFSTDVPVYRFNRYAVDFDGTDDYMSVPDSNDLSFGNASTDSAFSISAWVKADNWTSFRIVSKGNSSSDAEYIFGGVSGSAKLALYLFDSSHSQNIAKSYNVVLNTGQWYHVGATYDGSGLNTGIELYVDGIRRTNTQIHGAPPYTAMHNTTGELSIGRSYIPDYGNGLIDEVAIFSSELSEADMTAIYNDGVPTNIASYSPVGWWRMGDNDNGTGTTITDQGSGGNNGTLTNGPTFSTDIPVYVFNRYSVEFDGVDDYMSVPDSNDLSFGDASTDSAFSISAWVKADNWTKFRIVNKGVNTSNREYQFGGDGSGGLYLYLFDLTNTVYIARGYNTNLNTGQWYHVVCTYSGSGTPADIKVYVDGAQVDNHSLDPGGYTAMHNTSSNLEVGTIGFVPDYANGKIEELAIFGTELSSAQVSAIYNAGDPADISSYSPVGWWRMGDNDGGTGTTITNQGSASGIDGTLTNGPTFSTDIPS